MLKVSMAMAGTILRRETRFKRTVSGGNPGEQSLEPLTMLFTPNNTHQLAPALLLTLTL